MKNIHADFQTVATADWEIGAIYAYDIIHNGKQDLSPYRHHTKESLIKRLSRFTLSSDGKTPMTEKGMGAMTTVQLKRILAAINRTNNLVDITKVHATDLPDGDILTYSFPCQDLSIAGNWYHNEGGIDRNAHNRSTLLWQIDRLLNEYEECDKDMPRFLLMENVSEILSKRNIKNFHEWCSILSSMGYENQVYTLDARNFGVPQTRVRTYMLSVLADTPKRQTMVRDYFFGNDLEMVKLPDKAVRTLENYLKLDYSNEDYYEEAVTSTPNFTESRRKIYLNNDKLAIDDRIVGRFAKTITTKQDRNPNSGIVAYEKNPLVSWNHHYRNLTPRECFLLMGFDEEQFDALKDNNFSVRSNKNMLSNAKMIKLAGNSIVVQVLEAIFNQVVEIDQMMG